MRFGGEEKTCWMTFTPYYSRPTPLLFAVVMPSSALEQATALHIPQVPSNPNQP